MSSTFCCDAAAATAAASDSPPPRIRRRRKIQNHVTHSQRTPPVTTLSDGKVDAGGCMRRHARRPTSRLLVPHNAAKLHGVQPHALFSALAGFGVAGQTRALVTATSRGRRLRRCARGHGFRRIRRGRRRRRRLDHHVVIARLRVPRQQCLGRGSRFVVRHAGRRRHGDRLLAKRAQRLLDRRVHSESHDFLRILVSSASSSSRSAGSFVVAISALKQCDLGSRLSGCSAPPGSPSVSKSLLQSSEKRSSCAAVPAAAVTDAVAAAIHAPSLASSPMRNWEGATCANGRSIIIWLRNRSDASEKNSKKSMSQPAALFKYTCKASKAKATAAAAAATAARRGRQVRRMDENRDEQQLAIGTLASLKHVPTSFREGGVDGTPLQKAEAQQQQQQQQLLKKTTTRSRSSAWSVKTATHKDSRNARWTRSSSQTDQTRRRGMGSTTGIFP